MTTKTPPTPLIDAIARNIQRYRAEAKWTQQHLADMVAALNVPWSRITVVEVEKGGRRVGVDELLTLARVFGKPVVLMLLPEDGSDVEVREGVPLTKASVYSLFEIGSVDAGDSAAVRARQLAIEIQDLQRDIDAFNLEQAEREERATNLHLDLEARQHELMQIEAEQEAKG